MAGGSGGDGSTLLVSGGFLGESVFSSGAASAPFITACVQRGARRADEEKRGAKRRRFEGRQGGAGAEGVGVVAEGVAHLPSGPRFSRGHSGPAFLARPPPRARDTRDGAGARRPRVHRRGQRGRGGGGAHLAPRLEGAREAAEDRLEGHLVAGAQLLDLALELALDAAHLRDQLILQSGWAGR